jgi:hypothetical protein
LFRRGCLAVGDLCLLIRLKAGETGRNKFTNFLRQLNSYQLGGYNGF